MKVRREVSVGRVARRGVALLAAAVVLSSCASYKGISSVPIPGGPGTSGDSKTIYVQMPNTLAINVNSRVRVADVEVGSVKNIELKDWIPTLTLQVAGDVELPRNATAAIGQTSLLGSQHVELDAPKDPSQEQLKDGDTIYLKNASAFPTTERVLASIAGILSGGGIPKLEVIQNEVNNLLTGRADEIKEFLGRLDTFTAELNQQRNDITRAIDSTNELLAVVARNNETLDRVLTEFPPLVKYFADSRELFVNAIESLGRISKAADEALAPPVSGNLNTNLELLQPALKQLVKASPYLIGALDLLLTAPFTVSSAPKAFRGDFINVSILADLTLSAVDNGLLTGTGFSGALRALEQSWGRDPATMIPDVRYTPNPHSTPNGPLVERGE